MKMSNRLRKMLEENGFEFVRRGKHNIYSNGKSIFVVPVSPSDRRTDLNQIRSLKRVLALEKSREKPNVS